MSYKRVIPCIFINMGKAVKWFLNSEVIAEDPVELAKHYNDHGADELIVFDLSSSDEEHEESIEIMRRMNRVIRIPMVAGGNIKRQEDVGKIINAGAAKVMIHLSKPEMSNLLLEASKEYGKENIAVSLNDFDALFKQQRLIEECASNLIFMHRLDLNSVMNITEIPCVIVTDTMEEKELINILKCPGVRGLSGAFVNQIHLDIAKFKEKCVDEDIKMASLENMIPFSELVKNEQGLVPAVLQNYRTGEVLMMIYLNEEAFENAIRTGKLSDRNIKAIYAASDRESLLIKVDQDDTKYCKENRTCYDTPLMQIDANEQNILCALEQLYGMIQSRKKNPQEGSYTNYLFDKGIDKILKKVGEGAVEIVIASKNPNSEDIKYEIADFLYHLNVLMVERGIDWDDIIEQLTAR